MSEPSEAPLLPEETPDNPPIEEVATVRRSTRRSKGKLAKDQATIADDASKAGLEREGADDEPNTQTVELEEAAGDVEKATDDQGQQTNAIGDNANAGTTVSIVMDE